MPTTNPLELSARVLETGVVDEPVNRIDCAVHELADDLAIVESFSHSVVVRTDDGLVAVDTSGSHAGTKVVASIRRWSTDPISNIVYTHGHLDHVGGSGAFAADAADRGKPRPNVIAHVNVEERFKRYELTKGYNRLINARQFRSSAPSTIADLLDSESYIPANALAPTHRVDDYDRIVVGSTAIELHHTLGETDDHLWGYLPESRVIVSGDYFIWNFPNAGNPQKVQRYPLEWAEALRSMADTDVELLVPAHGLPIAGHDVIATALRLTADTLERLCLDVIEAMNTGATLDTIVAEVSVPPELLEVPYLRPLYDEPEFIIRNTWRRYGGWWDGNPARLKPPTDASLAAEVSNLVGSTSVLVDRAIELAGEGDYRIACQLIEWAHNAEPDDPEIAATRRDLYAQRRTQESSLMARGIYGSAAADPNPQSP